MNSKNTLSIEITNAKGPSLPKLQLNQYLEENWAEVKKKYFPNGVSIQNVRFYNEFLEYGFSNCIKFFDEKELPNVAFLLGADGSGKTTIIIKLFSRNEGIYFSFSELFPSQDFTHFVTLSDDSKAQYFWKLLIFTRKFIITKLSCEKITSPLDILLCQLYPFEIFMCNIFYILYSKVCENHSFNVTDIDFSYNFICIDGLPGSISRKDQNKKFWFLHDVFLNTSGNNHLFIPVSAVCFRNCFADFDFQNINKQLYPICNFLSGDDKYKYLQSVFREKNQLENLPAVWEKLGKICMRPQFLVFVLRNYFRNHRIDYSLELLKKELMKDPSEFFKDIDLFLDSYDPIYANISMKQLMINSLIMKLTFKGNLLGVALCDKKKKGFFGLSELDFFQCSVGFIIPEKNLISEPYLIDFFRSRISYLDLCTEVYRSSQLDPSASTVGFRFEFLGNFAYIYSVQKDTKILDNLQSFHGKLDRYLEQNDPTMIFIPSNDCGPDLIYVESGRVHLVQYKMVTKFCRPLRVDAYRSTDPNFLFMDKNSNVAIDNVELRNRVIHILEGLTIIRKVIYYSETTKYGGIPKDAVISNSKQESENFWDFLELKWDDLKKCKNRFIPSQRSDNAKIKRLD